MAVPPHPHIGLQTVTWLMAGQRAAQGQPGQRADDQAGPAQSHDRGRGIAHAEESPVEHDPDLHGVQLWVALPEASRLTEPAFEHHAELPVASAGGLAITVLIGSLAGCALRRPRSPTSSAPSSRRSATSVSTSR